jgi:hypothetical protein
LARIGHARGPVGAQAFVEDLAAIGAEVAVERLAFEQSAALHLGGWEAMVGRTGVESREGGLEERIGCGAVGRDVGIVGVLELARRHAARTDVREFLGARVFGIDDRARRRLHVPAVVGALADRRYQWSGERGDGDVAGIAGCGAAGDDRFHSARYADEFRRRRRMPAALRM